MKAEESARRKSSSAQPKPGDHQQGYESSSSMTSFGQVSAFRGWFTTEPETSDEATAAATADQPQSTEKPGEETCKEEQSKKVKEEVAKEKPRKKRPKTARNKWAFC